MQRHGKGGVSMTLPPLPVWSKKVSWIQGSEKNTFFKNMPFRIKWLLMSSSLFFSKVAQIWLKDEWKMYEEEIEAEQKT